MPLRVVQSPGCADVLTDDELGLGGDEVLIDSGKIAQSLGYEPTDPDANRALLRVAAAMRSTAIQVALENGVDGIVRTSNSNPARVQRLLAQVGGKARVVDISRAEACRRIRRLFPNNRDRQLLCEQGLDRYFDER